MATAFRIVLGLALGAVATVTVLEALPKPSCYTLVAIANDTAYVFDSCQGVVYVQPLPKLNLTPA